MAEEQETKTTEGGGQKKKSRLLLFVLLGVLLLVLAGGGYYAFMLYQHQQRAAETEMAPTTPEQVTDAVGEVFMLEPFVVNLADPQGKRYLKVQIGLELESPEAVERANRLVPRLRDMVIILLTSLTFEEVMTPEGKIQVRDELLQRFNQIMRPDRVRNIYFTEFVVQ